MPDQRLPDPLHTLVLPSARQATLLRRDHIRRQRATGLVAWQAPEYIGFEPWLVRLSLAARCAGRLGAALAVLGHEQTHTLWREVIGEDSQLAPTQVEALARLMREADETVFAHGLAPAWASMAGLSNEQALAREWYAAFRRRCGELRVASRTMLGEWCASARDWIAPDSTSATASRGFENAGPVLRTLLPARALTAQPPISAAPGRHVFNAVDEEFDAAIDWALRVRAEGTTGTVAIVCPNVPTAEGLQRRAQRWLNASPATDTLNSAAVICPAGGTRLASAPLVAHGLLALSAMQRLLPAEAVTLLESPFLRAWQTESSARAQLAARLQAERLEPLSLMHLSELLHSAGSPVLAAQLAQVQTLLDGAARRLSMAGWVALFQQALGLLGWPGETGLALQEQAAYEAWQRALDTAAALDVVLPAQTAPAALARLRSVMRGISGAEAIAPDAIEILSVEDASVLRPVRAWMLSLHDAAWPSATSQNPLLPAELLRRAAVPGTDFAADARHAEACLATIIAHAQEAVLSYAVRDGETPLRPSGAVDWSLKTSVAVPSLPGRWRQQVANAVLEPRPPDPPMPLEQHQRQRGGAELLADQAACAFKAYARYRLHAQHLDDATPGLDSRERGQLVHEVLASVWTALADSRRAAALAPMEMDELISSAVDSVLRDRRGLGARELALEHQRLRSLAHASVTKDLTRPPFAVQAIEAEQTLVLEGLALRLRPDRIDRLDSGACVILDYKTGTVKRADWSLPRPRAPQLLAYALATPPGALAGIAFAQVQAKGCKIVSEPSTLSDAPDVIATLDVLREAWRVELSRLAREFVAGVASVDPRKQEETCQLCDLQLLCRIHEQVQVTEDAALEEPDEP